MSQAQQAAIKAVKNGTNPDDIQELSTGYKVRFKPVSRFILLDAFQNIQDPPVPVNIDEQQGREYPNPNDPVYLQTIADNSRKREQAMAEVVLMLGVEVIEPLMPEGDDWLAELKWLEKRGHIDLSTYDFNDPVDRTMAWKRYLVFGNNNDFAKVIARANDIDEGVVLSRMNSFQREALRDLDLGSTPEESEELSE